MKVGPAINQGVVPIDVTQGVQILYAPPTKTSPHPPDIAFNVGRVYATRALGTKTVIEALGLEHTDKGMNFHD